MGLKDVYGSGGTADGEEGGTTGLSVFVLELQHNHCGWDFKIEDVPTPARTTRWFQLVLFPQPAGQVCRAITIDSEKQLTLKMKLSHLVWREISHRRGNFCLMLISVVLAVACGVCAITLFDAQHQYNQQQIGVLDNEIRKITKNMGFNILILPRDQNLADFYADDFASQTMPESHVEQLAKSRDVFTIRHLRPALVRKLTWHEKNRQVILMGVRGVVPFAHRNPKKPLADPVPPGKIDVGHLLAQELAMAPGQRVTLLGVDFEVNKVNPVRGNKDDITVWVDLAQAQQMLHLPGKINMIQALECNCASVDRLAEIEAEVSGVLKDEVQVVELATKAIARAKARTRVSAEGEARLQRWRRIAAAVIPLTIFAAGLMVGLLSFANVQQRLQEIGILRALGLRSNQLLGVLLAKPAVVGMVGAVLGYLVGIGGAWSLETVWFMSADYQSPPQWVFKFTVLLVVLLLTPLLTVMAGWLPAFYASGKDPAEILNLE